MVSTEAIQKTIEDNWNNFIKNKQFNIMRVFDMALTIRKNLLQIMCYI